MSNLVDERVVQMGFDNKNFESNVKTSMNTLDKLKSSLNFSGVSNSLNKNLGGVDTSIIASSLSRVSNSFSAMEVVAISAIANITNRVIDLGIQMIKSLSLDNIAAGWDKYGQKTTSVATLISQGYDMETVTKQLEKLQWYTDETSYEFTQMVSNISKFTASGQGLEESVQAMMGIANWAALSGQNAQTASRAMYQLSQAMGSGVIRLMDWKSIQNANMDTKEFRQTALDTAVAMGQLQQSVDGTYTTLTGKSFGINQFTTELDEQWFTAEILMKTLEKYSSAVDDIYDIIQTDDEISLSSEAMEKYGYTLDEFGLKAFRAAQEARTMRDALNAVREAVGSAWTNIFENIFGSYDTAKVLWTDLANELYGVFVEGWNVTNSILKAWNESGGRNDLFANTEEETGAFWNLFYAIVEIRDLVKKAWDTIFPFSELAEGEGRVQDIANKVRAFTLRLKEMSEGLYLSEEAADTLSNILQGTFSVIKLFLRAVGTIWTGIQPVINIIKLLMGEVFNLLGSLGAELTKFVSTTTIFEVAGQKISKLFTIIIDEIRNLNLLDDIRNLFNQLSKAFQTNGGNIENYIRILNGLKAAYEIIQRVFITLWGAIENTLLPAFAKLLNIGAKLVGVFGGNIVKLLAWIGDLIVRFNEFTKTNDTFQKGMDSVISFIESIPSRLAFLAPFLNTVKDIIPQISCLY